MIREKIDKFLNNQDNITTIIYTFIIALLAFGMTINQHVINHDSVSRLAGMGNDSRLSTGRYFIEPIYKYLHDNQILTVVIFMFTSLFFGLSSVYICKIFDVKSRLYRILVTIFIFCFPLVGFYYPYGQDSSAYAIALFLSILSVYFLIKDGWKNHLIFIIITGTYLGIYQSYVSVAFSIFILYYFINFVTSDKIDYKYFIKRFIIMFIALICYYVFLKVLLLVSGNQLGNYLNADNKSTGNILMLFPLIYRNAFYDFYGYLTCDIFFFDTSFNLIWINLIFIAIYVSAFIKSMGLKKGVIALVVFILIFVPSLFIVNFMTGTNLRHARYGLLVFPVGALILARKANFKEYIEVALIAVFIISGFNNWMQLNQEFSKLVQMNETSEAIAFDIRMDLVETEGYNVEDEIYFVGSFRTNEYMQLTNEKPYNYLWKKEVDVINYLPGYSIESNTTASRNDAGFLMEYMGFELNYTNATVFSGMTEEELTTISDAPSYPHKGYIFEINGVYFIKLGDMEEEIEF